MNDSVVVPLSKFAKSREQLDGEHPAQAAFRRRGLVFKRQEAQDPEAGVPPSDRQLRSATGGEGRGRVGVPRAQESEPAVSESGRRRSASRSEGSKKALGTPESEAVAPASDKRIRTKSSSGGGTGTEASVTIEVPRHRLHDLLDCE